MNQPTQVANKTLVKALISAIILAVIIYFIVILPAEYNKDPTGLGEKLGLLVLSSPNVSKDQTKTTSLPQNISAEDNMPSQEDEVIVTVPAHKGIEYKFNLKKYGRLVYKWQTLDESSIYFDFHGEPKGDTTGFFESYSISTANMANGTATVPFAGIHGWYWKNTSDKEVKIKLTTSGKYTVVGIK